MRMPALALVALAATTSLAAQPAPPRARLVEDLRLDATAEDFPSVRSVYVGPRGQIVVPIRQDGQLRVYDAAGKKLAALGRKGRGPGEYEYIAVVGWKGDTLWVNDVEQRRLTYYSPGLELLRTAAYLFRNLTVPAGSGPAPPGTFTQFLPRMIRPDGTMLGNAYRSSGEGGPGQSRGSDYVLLAMPLAGAPRVIAALPAYADARWTMTIAGLSNDVPFAAQPQIAHASSGDRFAHMTSAVTSRDGGTFTVSVFGAAGDTMFVRTYPFRGVPIPRAVRDSALAAFIAKSGRPTEGPADLPRRFQALAREKMPPIYPGVESLVLGLDETVWVGLRRTPEGQPVLVLDRRGNPIATVHVPPRSRLAQASRSHVWITETDADGLTSVVRYRVTGIP